LEGLGAPTSRVHSYRGGHAITGIPAYEALLYRGLAEGVDVQVHHRRGRLEYDLLLGPGAEPGALVMHLAGAAPLALRADGALVTSTGAGELVQSIPAAWQVRPDGSRAPVRARFRLIDEKRYGFVVEGREPGLPLVIDPSLTYSTYLGGTLGDRVTAVVAGPGNSGTAYVAGYTAATDFPTTAGAEQPELAGESDAFVAKLDLTSGALVWSTYLGGSDAGFLVGESATGLALAADGRVYVTGWANSNDFPTTPGAWSRTRMGGVEAFVCRLGPGGLLEWGSYLGGTGEERGTAIGLAADGVVVTGRAFSSDFPTTPGAYDTSFNSIFFSDDAFVSKLALDGGTLLWSTYLGGLLRDEATALAIDAGGAVHVTGLTGSASFPGTAGSFDPTYNGAGPNDLDVFVSRLSASGDELLWSGLLGGVGMEEGAAIALGPGGSVVVAGLARDAGFPTTAGVWQAGFAGGAADAFAARIASGGSSVIWSTLLGGSDEDYALGLACDAFGLVTLDGVTKSFDFPRTADAYDVTLTGSSDAFVARLAPDGAVLRYGSFFGGAGADEALALGRDVHGAALLGGQTDSAALPLTAGAVDTSAGGGIDGFLARIEVPPWSDKGFGKAGTGGLVPLLAGAGSLKVGTPGSLTLSQARPSSVALLFAGFVTGNAPFKQGTLVPFPPSLQFTFVTSPAGTLPLGWAAWPAGLPVGFSVYLQFWIADPVATAGASASNAVRAIQP
ncbi:MAG TPA: hypothetical protein VFD43_08835, partial [Planctomycetota bacterium]|nr:hypothetical protein [Planctomycetota bacterium]